MSREEAEEKFAQFADLCIGFVEEMGGALGEEVDPIEEAQRSAEIIGSITKKWTVPIIYLLYRSGNLGFSELANLLMGISSRTLSLRLKSLEKKGWVRREVMNDRPPRVRYSLTESGGLVAKMAAPMYLYLRSSAERQR